MKDQMGRGRKEVGTVTVIAARALPDVVGALTRGSAVYIQDYLIQPSLHPSILSLPPTFAARQCHLHKPVHDGQAFICIYLNGHDCLLLADWTHSTITHNIPETTRRTD